MSDESHDNWVSLLAHWFTPGELPQLRVEPIAGGLSGAKLWKVTIAQHSYCLRRWPASFGPGIDQLRTIHGLIEHVWTAGFQPVPLPQRTLSHKTVVEDLGHLWELTTWLVGEVVEDPTVEQTSAAVDALAQFHRVAASYGEQRVAVAPGLQSRAAIVMDLQKGGLADLELSVRYSPPSAEREIALPLLEDLAAVLPYALCHIRSRVAIDLPLQWCLRDVHIGNFLFAGGVATGLVDVGAAAVDSVAGDLARLIASFADEDRLTWYRALGSYERRRPLSSDERQAIGAYTIGGWIGAAANWLRWRFIEARSVADTAITQTRLSDLAARIRMLRAGEGTFSGKMLLDR